MPTKLLAILPLFFAAIIIVSWLLLGGGRGLVIYRRASATKVRRTVFSILLAWASYDAVMTFRTWDDLPIFFRVCGLVGSLLWSLLFIGLIAIIWDWLARRWHARTSTRN